MESENLLQKKDLWFLQTHLTLNENNKVTKYLNTTTSSYRISVKQIIKNLNLKQERDELLLKSYNHFW
jgi:hypothetical protein